MSLIEIIPSLPALSFSELESKAAKVAGLVETFQIDVADGMFVTNRSWPMNPGDRAQFERIISGKERLPFSPEMQYEVHFMAHHPEKLIPDWVKAGAVRALIHVESRHDFAACRAAAGDALELGIVLKVGTAVERIEAYLPHVAVVQVMGIEKIGVQGQPFDQRALGMVEAVHERYPGVTIEVDGAVNADTAPRLVEAGATRLAPGSFVFHADDPAQAIASLKNQ